MICKIGQKGLTITVNGVTKFPKDVDLVDLTAVFKVVMRSEDTMTLKLETKLAEINEFVFVTEEKEDECSTE
jgi:hypothetical protein